MTTKSTISSVQVDGRTYVDPIELAAEIRQQGLRLLEQSQGSIVASSAARAMELSAQLIESLGR